MEPLDQDLDESELELPTEPMLLNVGPAHPAMHGTVRMVLEVEGEKIVSADVQVGYLHRCFEKESEHATYTQIFPYTDRLNYVSPMLNNVGYALAVEKLLGSDKQVPERAIGPVIPYCRQSSLVMMPMPSMRSRKMRLRVSSLSTSTSTSRPLRMTSRTLSPHPSGMSPETPPMRT